MRRAAGAVGALAGVRGGPAAARAVDRQVQRLGVRVGRAVGQGREPEAVDGADGLAGRAGDGAVELGLGHGKLLFGDGAPRPVPARTPGWAAALGDAYVGSWSGSRPMTGMGQSGRARIRPDGRSGTHRAGPARHGEGSAGPPGWRGRRTTTGNGPGGRPPADRPATSSALFSPLA